jgi:hypothetical protein
MGKMNKLAIATVGFFAFIFFAGMTAVWYFSPPSGISEQLGQIKVGDMVVSDAFKEGVDIHGQEEVGGTDVRVIKIPFNTAKIDVSHTTRRRLTWDCKVANDALSPHVERSAGVLTLNLDRLALAKCSIRIPIGPRAEFKGVNGHMEVDYPGANLDIALDNGRVKIMPDPNRAYDFDVKVKNGLQDFFPRTKAKDAIKVKISVVNGMVKKE